MKKPNYLYSMLIASCIWLGLFLIGWFLYLSLNRTEYISLDSSWLILGVPLIAFLCDSLFHAIKKVPVTIPERLSQLVGIFLADLFLPFMLYDWFEKTSYQRDLWDTFLYLCAASCYYLLFSSWPFLYQVKLLLSGLGNKKTSRILQFSLFFFKCFASAVVVGAIAMFFSIIFIHSARSDLSILQAMFLSAIIIYAVEPFYLFVVLFLELIRYPRNVMHRFARISALTLFYFLPILLYSIPAFPQQRWEWFSDFSSYGLSWLFLFITICGLHDCAIRNHHISKSIHGSN